MPIGCLVRERTMRGCAGGPLLRLVLKIKDILSIVKHPESGMSQGGILNLLGGEFMVLYGTPVWGVGVLIQTGMLQGRERGNYFWK